MDDERLSDDLAAWACFRLDRLQPGLRMLHLYDSNGVVTKGVLLVRICKTVSGDTTPTAQNVASNVVPNAAAAQQQNLV